MKRRIIDCLSIVLMLSVVGCGDQAASGTSDQQVTPAQEKKADSLPIKPDTQLVNAPVVEKPAEEKPKATPAATEKKKVESKTAQPETETVPSEAPKGKELIALSDCKTCHKVDEKAIGPSFQEIAKKYPSGPENIQRLADKIIAGGAGAWGQMPMTPHPAIAVADAKKMVAYILSLK